MPRKKEKVSLEFIVNCNPYSYKVTKGRFLSSTFTIYYEETPIRSGVCTNSSAEHIEDVVNLLNCAYHEGMIRSRSLLTK